MPKKRMNKLPCKAKTMGSSQRETALQLGKKNARTVVEQTSTVTVLRPDATGNFVAVEVLAPVFAKPATRQRAKIPRGSKSLL